MKVGDLVKIQVFKGDTAIKRALVLKVDADLIKVAINSEGCSNMTTWLHKEHVKVISHGK